MHLPEGCRFIADLRSTDIASTMYRAYCQDSIDSETSARYTEIVSGLVFMVISVDI